MTPDNEPIVKKSHFENDPEMVFSDEYGWLHVSQLDAIHSLSQQNEQLEKQVLAMREALSNIESNLNLDDEASYARDDRQGAIDASYAIAKEALSSTPADIAKKWVSVEHVNNVLQQIADKMRGIPQATMAARILEEFRALTLAQKELEKV